MSVSSLAIERSKAVICRNLFNDHSELLLVDRFELLRTLGSGGMGIVYEAYDPTRAEPVALKTLKGRSAGDLYRLKREFRALAELAHPNLVTLHELSIARQHAFFTMELVAGRDIISFVRQGTPAGEPPRDQARLGSALAQLCEGMRALHAAGKLHRDLKPSNVLVTEAGRLVLLDFGLVQDVREPSGDVGGTPGFMAPEQRRGRACESSDWYAFGRILELALTGESAAPCPPAAGELGRLAEALLVVDPWRRAGWREVSAVVRGLGQPARWAPSAVRAGLERAPGADAFVGRTQELTALEHALDRSRRGPVLVVLRGESGIGKTTLMRRFVASALAKSEALVLSSRCYEREFIPFKALDGAIDELSRHLSAGERPASLGADDQRALLHLFPVLGRVPWFAPESPAGDEVHPMVQRRRGFDALKKVFAALAKERPLVLCIDDLQWSDADSGVLLSELLCNAEAPPLLVLASDRTDPGRLNPAIEELYRAAGSAQTPATIEELRLGALASDEAAQLARTLLLHEGSTDRRTLALVTVESRGNPLFLKELSRWAGAVPGSIGGGTTIDAIVESRVRDLSGAARRALDLLAVAGRPLPTAVIAPALELSGDQHALVRELRDARLVHLARRADAELLELDHDRIAEALLRKLAPARRQDLHARLARALDADDRHGEAALAQYLAADLPEQAAQCARQAGYLALAALAFARAAWLFRKALELGRWPDATRAHLYGELALALEHGGHGLEAAQAYQEAVALTAEPAAAVGLEIKAAEHLARNGRNEEGFALARHAYETLGVRWPHGRLELTLALIKLFVEAQAPCRPKHPEHAAPETARVRMLAAAGPLFEGFDMARTLYNALLALREGERMHGEEWRVRVLALRGFMRCTGLLLGGPARGIKDVEEACAGARALGDLDTLTQLQAQCAVSHYVTGRPRAALDWATRCEDNLMLQPLPPEARSRIRGLMVAALYELGELREAELRWRGYAHDARFHNDLFTGFWTHGHPVQLAVRFASEDRAGASAILEKQARLRAQNPGFQLLAWSHALSRIENALYWDQADLACNLAELEWRGFSRSGFPFLNAVARTARARAYVAAAVRARGAQRMQLLGRAWLDARGRCGVGSPAARGGAQFVCASVALLSGRTRSARRQLQASMTALDVAGSKLLAASARYCLGALEADVARGGALQAAAAEVLTQEGILNPRRWVAWTVPGIRTIIEPSDG
jgi:hypothetical protein